MEKPTTSKTKGKLVKLLQKAIRNLPRKNKKGGGVAVETPVEMSSEPGFSITKGGVNGGQMVKNPSFGEPSSPKISCIGQVKHRKKMAKNIHLFLHQEICPAMASRTRASLMKPSFFLPEEEKIPSNMRINTQKNNNIVSKQVLGTKSSLDQIQMKRFPSFHDDDDFEFDCKFGQIEANDYVNDEFSEEQEEEGVKSDFCFTFVGRSEVKARKEVNLWRRRRIDQPKPLYIRSPSASLAAHRFRC